MEIRITRESLRQAGACYSDAQIDALIPVDGIGLDAGMAIDIPVSDKHWALCYAAGGIPDRILREHACWCARQTLERERAAGREPDTRSWHSVEVAERFARGDATQDELAAAWDAARAAAWAAASAAAWAASCAAASAAAWAAAWAASCAAAWDAQLSDLVNRIHNA